MRTMTLLLFGGAAALLSGCVNHHNRGADYSRQGEHELAAREFTLAIDELRDTPPESGTRAMEYWFRGREYEALGDRRRALDDYNRSIRLWPGLADCFVSRGLILRDEGRLPEAAADFTKAIEVHGPTKRIPPGLVERADTYLRMGSGALALQDFNSAIDLERDAWRAYAGRAEAHYELGRYAEAWQDVDRVKALGGNVPAETVAKLNQKHPRPR